MRLVGQTHYADLRGPTACELLTSAEARALRARLGADPLRTDADPDTVWARISASRSPLATLLMDQKVLAGVGNVYRAEVLFRHGLDPQLPGRALDRETWDAMWADLVVLMRDGVRTGRIDTVRPEHDPRRRGEPGRTDGTAGRSTSTAAPGWTASSAGRRCGTPSTRTATCSGARAANRQPSREAA